MKNCSQYPNEHTQQVEKNICDNELNDNIAVSHMMNNLVFDGIGQHCSKSIQRTPIPVPVFNQQEAKQRTTQMRKVSHVIARCHSYAAIQFPNDIQRHEIFCFYRDREYQQHDFGIWK